MTAREVIESTYKGVCKVYESRQVKDRVTKITSDEKVVVNEFPCHVSLSSSSLKREDTVFVKVQQTKLFCSPEHMIKAGSVMEITQNGRTALYEHSGVPAVYETHQEVVLTLKEAYT